MTDKTNEEIVKQVVFEILIPKHIVPSAEFLKLEHILIEELGADSLDLVELCMAIEDEFEIEVTDEMFESFLTVGHIITHVDQFRK
jgi:acyl carrier protein